MQRTIRTTFQSNFPLHGLILLIDTLMEEMKSVIAGEYEFEYRDKSKLKPFFQRFGLSGV